MLNGAAHQMQLTVTEAMTFATIVPLGADIVQACPTGWVATVTL
jgi:hypothetical protein